MSANEQRVGDGSAWLAGPWDYERVLDAQDLARPWVGRLSENRFAALACGDDRAEAMANARLIAAAPDLYEALEHILAGALSLPRFAEEQACAALSLARGEA